MAIVPCRAKWAGTLTDRQRFNKQNALQACGSLFQYGITKGPEAIKAYLESLAPAVERGGYDYRCPPNVKVDDYVGRATYRK